MTTTRFQAPARAREERVTSASGSATLAELAGRAAAAHAGTSLRYKENGSWTEFPFPSLARAAREIAKGLIALGIDRGDRVSILGNTRAEWTLADLGALTAGATVAPIYHRSEEHT